MLLAAMNSCSEDWLATKSHDKILIDEYYNSEARIYEALIAAYDPMHYFDYCAGGVTNPYNPLPTMSDVMSDDIFPGGSSSTDQAHFHLAFNYTSLPTNTYDGAWATAYEGVNRANSVAYFMPGVLDISEPRKKLFLAEAAVLRTFYYSILWKFFGNIPYYETNLESPYIPEQFTADQVYEAMIAALEEAMTNGGLPMRVSDPALQGRVSWAMAAMLYAEIVMYQNDETRFAKALGYMEDIIDSGQYDLIDFALVFEQEGEWSEESIFEINYFSQGAYRSWGSPKNVGGSVYPRMAGVDGLTGSAKYSGSGWGTGCAVRPGAVAMYEEGDVRYQYSIYEPAAEGAGYKPRYQDTGFFLAKYLPRPNSIEGQIADADLNHNNNFRVYRFSETLLNAAELIARGTSGSGSAADYLLRVRTRAGLGQIAATVDNIIEERHLEFLGEGKRYWDLVRSGKAASVLVPEGDVTDPNVYRKNSWTASKKYMPIPQAEISAAHGALTQNNY